MRLPLLFTLIQVVRLAFSWKRHRLENPFESGPKRKRIRIVLLWTVENGIAYVAGAPLSTPATQAKNGRKSIKFKTMTLHVSRGLFPGFSLVFVACAESSTYVTAVLNLLITIKRSDLI